MISCNGEPYTLKGVSTVLRGDYANLLQKCDKAAFSYSTCAQIGCSEKQCRNCAV